MTCATCGATAAAGQRFCAACGGPFVAASALVPVAREPAPMHGPELAATNQVGYGASGPACPICFDTLFANRYTVWHVLATVVLFPIGAVTFLAPIRVCRNRHRYGAGVWVAGTIKIVLVVAALAAAAAIWLLLDSFRRIAHVFG